jgi:hypothetical protein
MAAAKCNLSEKHTVRQTFARIGGLHDRIESPKGKRRERKKIKQIQTQLNLFIICSSVKTEQKGKKNGS